MLNLINIGQRVRKRREFMGYTREKLAEKISVTPKFCSDIELGVKGFSINTLSKLCEALNIPSDYILFGKENDSDVSNITSMLYSCDKQKLAYLEDMIKSYIQSHN